MLGSGADEPVKPEKNKNAKSVKRKLQNRIKRSKMLEPANGSTAETDGRETLGLTNEKKDIKLKEHGPTNQTKAKKNSKR
jgi:hypothetical protein